jgi:hypothetical protein
MVAVNPILRSKAMGGFSLVELMLSLSLGLALSGVMLQGLMAEGQNGARFSRLLRERAAQRRSLELVKHDVAQAAAVSEKPALEEHGCSLAGRIPVLHLRSAAGPITYSVGAAPSAIWRGRVLMRCGPAYGLDGRITAGSAPTNRVVIDGLPLKPTQSQACQPLLPGAVGELIDLGGATASGFSACLQTETGLLALKLEQAFAQGADQKAQSITQMLLVDAPNLSP